MKTQRKHFERQLIHSHELMVRRIKKANETETMKAYIVGIGIIAAWLILVGVCYVLR